LVSHFTELFRLEQRAAALRLSWLSEIDARGLATGQGATSTWRGFVVICSWV
jgi:hypothetical protein